MERKPKPKIFNPNPTWLHVCSLPEVFGLVGHRCTDARFYFFKWFHGAVKVK